MPSFHNNKLNTVSLDDSDDQSYTPTKKVAKGKKPTPKSKARLSPNTTMRMPNLCCIPRKRSKRKRDQPQAGQVGTLYEGQNNHSTDNGTAGTPMELASQRPPSDLSSVLPLEPLRNLIPRGSSSTVNTQTSWNFTAEEFANRREYEMLGNPSRWSFDIGPDVLTGYPNTPPWNTWAERENREHFGELPGDAYDPILPDLARKERKRLAMLQAQSSGNNNNGFHYNLGGDLGLPNDSDINGGNSRAGVSAPTLDSGSHSLPNGEASSGGYAVQGRMSSEIKEEMDQSDHPVSSNPLYSEYEESDMEDRRASKVPKINKDGAPRKPRQPRPKLLKWSDNDWKNVALGLVWACGENGIQIPFDQAAQVVGDSCTAGALQQALLKLRCKQIAEGIQIPSLRMAWARKNKNSASSSSTANANNAQDSTPTKSMLPKKKPTRWEGNQSFIITLKRAYQKADRMHLDSPHTYKKAPRQKQRVRTGNAIMINDNSSGDVSSTSHHADQYADYVMDDAKSAFDVEMDHAFAIPHGNDNRNDLMAFVANPTAGDLSLPGNGLKATNAATTFTGYTLPRGSTSAHRQVDLDPNSGSPINGNANFHRSSVSVQDDPRQIASMFLDGTLASPTRPMPQNFDAGCNFLNSDPNMRNRKVVVFDSRSDLYTPTMGHDFYKPGQSMPPSPRLSPGKASDTPSGPSNAYNVASNSAHDTAPTTPVSNSVYGTAFGSPGTDFLRGAGDNAPATGGVFDYGYAGYGGQGLTPVTPPRSAAADRIIADRLNSTLREDGAFNPQGANNMYRGTWNGFNDMNNWPLNTRQNDYNVNIEDDEENDSKVVSNDDGQTKLADPFVDFSAHH